MMEGLDKYIRKVGSKCIETIALNFFNFKIHIKVGTQLSNLYSKVPMFSILDSCQDKSGPIWKIIMKSVLILFE